jgi:hypothetical protein
MSISALPASPALTWQHNLNQTQAAAAAYTTDDPALLLKIVNAMIGFGANPWTVLGSSDSSTAGLDSVNRWSSVGKLVWNNAASAHSWIVLKQTGLSTNAQLLISCEGGGAGATATLLVSFSPSAGFTGGTITARPTATDECIATPAGTAAFGWVPSTNAASQFIVNVQQSTDGSFTRMWISYSNLCIAYWHFAKLANADTGVTYGIDCLLLGAGSFAEQVTAANLITTTTGNGRARPVSSNVATRLSVLSSGGSNEGANMVAASVYSSKWPTLAPWVVDVTNKAFLGSLPDTYIGSTTRVSADAYPAGGTKVWGHVSILIVPTGGTALTKA